MDMARLAATRKSTATAGRGMINRPTMTTKPIASAMSFDFSRLCNRFSGFAGDVATISNDFPQISQAADVCN